jgi:formate/nitrite transporter FocA (FNT family)
LPISELLFILFGNLVGVFIIYHLAIVTAVISKETILDIAKIKLSVPIFTLFFRAILCGALMTLATQKDTSQLMTVGCVFAFVICGLNHCIADFFYVLSTHDLIFELLVIIVGNFVGGIAITRVRPRIN